MNHGRTTDQRAVAIGFNLINSKSDQNDYLNSSVPDNTLKMDDSELPVASELTEGVGFFYNLMTLKKTISMLI